MLNPGAEPTISLVNASVPAKKAFLSSRLLAKNSSYASPSSINEATIDNAASSVGKLSSRIEAMNVFKTNFGENVFTTFSLYLLILDIVSALQVFSAILDWVYFLHLLRASSTSSIEAPGFIASLTDRSDNSSIDKDSKLLWSCFAISSGNCR